MSDGIVSNIGCLNGIDWHSAILIKQKYCIDLWKHKRIPEGPEKRSWHWKHIRSAQFVITIKLIAEFYILYIFNMNISSLYTCRYWSPSEYNEHELNFMNKCRMLSYPPVTFNLKVCVLSSETLTGQDKTACHVPVAGGRVQRLSPGWVLQSRGASAILVSLSNNALKLSQVRRRWRKGMVYR